MGTDKRTIEAYNEYARKWVEINEKGLNIAHDLPHSHDAR